MAPVQVSNEFVVSDQTNTSQAGNSAEDTGMAGIYTSPKNTELKYVEYKSQRPLENNMEGKKHEKMWGQDKELVNHWVRLQSFTEE